MDKSFCYCEIGAGGKPCRDREHCDKFYNNQRCRFDCRTARENWMQGYIEAQHNAARAADLDAQEAWKDVQRQQA